MTIPAGKVLFSARAHADEIGSIAFAPGDRLLATASRDGKIGLWRRSQRGFDRIMVIEAPGPVEQVQFNSDGTQLLALTPGESSLRLFRLDRLRDRLNELGLAW